MKDKEEFTMKNYNITLSTTTFKDLNIVANSKEDAICVARLMYPDADNMEHIYEEDENNQKQLEDLIFNMDMAINEAKLAIGDIERALNYLLDYFGVDCLALS